MELLFILILIGLLVKRSKSRKYRSRKSWYSPKRCHKQNNWKSEWKWDEENQLWVHPHSAKPISSREGQEDFEIPEPEITIDFSHAYQAQQLFTKNEWQNYKTLREITQQKGYVICPKVRLLDIVRPRSGEQKYKTLLYKIQSKHVDFVICDQNMNIKAVLELDDKTHDTEKGIARDTFVDTVLQSVGYKVIHTRYISKELIDMI